MDRPFSTYRSAQAGERWLVLLVAAMDEAARPEIRALPCEASTLAGLRAQLALPAPSCGYRATSFSLNN